MKKKIFNQFLDLSICDGYIQSLTDYKCTKYGLENEKKLAFLEKLHSLIKSHYEKNPFLSLLVHSICYGYSQSLTGYKTVYQIWIFGK